MLIYYHKDPQGNFGDDLNPWLWNRLLPGVFSGEVYHDPTIRQPIPKTEELFVGIGTLLNEHVPSGLVKHVFGSGTGYGAPPHVDQTWRFHCVRGPLTCKAMGLDSSLSVTDPAVLVRTLPAFQSPRAPTDIAYMPHCASARNADWKGICDEVGIAFIDPQWPVERVLPAILRTRLLVTEALHGAIVADAMRIPWRPIVSQSGVLSFKWLDWCASLNLPYVPAHLPALWSPRKTSTIAEHFKFRIKRRIAVRRLRNVVSAGTSVLSSDSVIERVTGELVKRVADFEAQINR
jgi:succinoglycan biosynthesis protein ExoV